MERKDFSGKAGKIFGGSAEVKRIATGFNFTEGPVWDEKRNILYFTDFNKNMIYKWTREGGTEVYTDDSQRTVGLSITKDGRLAAALSRLRAIGYIDQKKSEVIACNFEGKRLNSPNDVLVTKRGDIFFTDPYSTAMGCPRELDYNGIFRCDPVTGETYLLDGSMERPNGLALSPDESVLYVNDTNRQSIMAFNLRSDRTVSKTGLFAVMDTSYGKGAADGMKTDTEGNVYLTGPGGIWVYDKDANPVTVLYTPEPAGNLCFGMEDNTTLIITASTSVYAVKTLIPGIVPPRED